MNYTLNESGFKDTIASKCLPGDTEVKCSAFWNYSISVQYNGQSHEYNATAKGPCVFPFIYKNKTYNTCTKAGTKVGAEYNWCAIAVNDQSNYRYCIESCPTEDIVSKPWFVMLLLVIIGSLTLLISLILLWISIYM